MPKIGIKTCGIKKMSEEKSGGGISLATKSRYNTPEHFFPVVVDDFFNDPEALVDFGKSLPKEGEDRQPGRRSQSLWEIDHNLCRAILLKIMSCYYDLDYIDLEWNNSILKFQEIPRSEQVRAGPERGGSETLLFAASGSISEQFRPGSMQGITVQYQTDQHTSFHTDPGLGDAGKQ